MGSKILSINWLFGNLALIKNVRETYSTIGAVLIFIPNLPLATKLRDWKNTRYLRFHFLDRICFPWLRRKNYVQKFGQLVLFSKYNLRGGQFQFHKITILINFVKMDQCTYPFQGLKFFFFDSGTLLYFVLSIRTNTTSTSSFPFFTSIPGTEYKRIPKFSPRTQTQEKRLIKEYSIEWSRWLIKGSRGGGKKARSAPISGLTHVSFRTYPEGVGCGNRLLASGCKV